MEVQIGDLILFQKGFLVGGTLELEMIICQVFVKLIILLIFVTFRFYCWGGNFWRDKAFML